MIETPEYNNPDRNEPAKGIRQDMVCLLYGFPHNSPLLNQLNGRECLIFGRSSMDGDGIYYPADQTWYEVHVRGMATTMDVSVNFLMPLDDSDALVIEWYSR